MGVVAGGLPRASSLHTSGVKVENGQQKHRRSQRCPRMQTPHPAPILSGFSQADFPNTTSQRSQECDKLRAILAQHVFHKRFVGPSAPVPLHAPVNELHSIEIKAHTNLLFLLT